ncbi:hypothetical protein F53441_7310 [Fusarium austroafricanum]|uniref:Uncharacterized protein n=1 Tax=Fusarium austroafricanum TaxID=2364996 RepID=A0A8H4NXS5_9HYPO|nr:hypothetical protein F53441_7310 [Fusarium austroafricanum]
MSYQRRAPSQHQSGVHHHFQVQGSFPAPSYESRVSGSVSNNPQNATAAGQVRPAPAPAPEPLIDLDNHENTPGRHGNKVAQADQNRLDLSSIDDFPHLQRDRFSSFLQPSEKRVKAQRTALQNVTAEQRLPDLEKKKLQEANIKLTEADANLAEAIQERDEQRRLADAGNWTGSGKVSDDTIRSKWKRFDYNIRSLASALAKCPPRKPSDVTVKKRLSSITSAWGKLLVNGDYKELLIYAYLWLIIDEQVLGESGMIRGGAAAPKTDRTKHQEPSLRHVARWLAQGTALFGHFLGRDQKAFRSLVNEEIGLLKGFCNIAADKSGSDFLQQMKGVIETALDLDEMLMGSKAIFMVRWTGHEQSASWRYDSDNMEAIAYEKDLSPKSHVKFDVAPLLVKIGNADGCNYDSRIVLCKALVVCE